MAREGPRIALQRKNRRDAKVRFPSLGRAALNELNHLSERYGISIAMGDLFLLDRRWYVTHSGLLRIAYRMNCRGIRVRQVREFCDASAGRWVFQATVYKSSGSLGFVGFGDADPSNVSALVRGAEMRVAETRAVNRALRKAYGIGLCSVEELSGPPGSPGNGKSDQSVPSAAINNGHQNGQPRLRDRLCLLIRQHRLDAGLVKAYAADFCGTPTLRDASREQVETFINHLTQRASNEREALLCHLNSYPKQEEATK
jgi:hypothetical protein